MLAGGLVAGRLDGEGALDGRCAEPPVGAVEVQGTEALAVLGALAAVQVMVNAPADPVLATALTVATLVFGVATVLLLRPRR